jgi:beta-lactamase class A
VDGSGILQFKEPGLQYTWAELMGLMISISDNLATNLFMEALGKDKLNAKIKEYGLKDSRIVRKIKQMIPGDNHSNADDMAQVLVALESRQFIDGWLYDFAIDLMKKTINKERIGRHAPKDVVVANKTGTLNSVVGDSALLFFPHRKPLVLTMFIHGNDEAKVDPEPAERCMGDIAKQVIDHYYNS